MAGRKTFKASEVLQQIFNIPSEDESDDNLESSDDDNDYAPACDSIIVEVEHVDKKSEGSSSDVEDDDEDDEDDDDDNILYQLVDTPSEEESDSSFCEDDENGWKEIPLIPSEIDFDRVGVLPKEPFLETDKPIDFFNKFFNPDLIHLLVQQTNLYAEQNHTRHWTEVDDKEMQGFIGMLIAMGIHSLPSFRHYFSTDPFYRVQPVADVMSRRRFHKLLGNIHVNDNLKAVSRGEPRYDKLHKIRPILTHLNNQFMGQAVSSSSQSIDEAMIPFKGRSSIKQYMPMKPVKRGYKVWIRADAKTGYVYQFELYTGKREDSSNGYGLGERVISNLTSALKNTYTLVTFDNYFSSVPLLEDLLKNNIMATCTVRSNRRELPVMAKMEQKMDRGQSKWLTRNNVAYVKWQDTKSVHVLSTAFCPSKIQQAKRVQKDGSSLSVTCPQPIVEYTKRMGGVDRFDQNRTMYSVSHKSKRWWLRIFYFLIDASITNAFVLYASVNSGKQLNLLNFRLDIFRSLVCGVNSRQRKSSIEGSPYVKYRVEQKKRIKLMGVPDEIRLDKGGHDPEKIATFRRCRLCSSRTRNKRSKIVCAKCRVPLCIAPCFGMFHRL